MRDIKHLDDDIKAAMKSKNAQQLNALRYFKSKLIENRTSPKPAPEQDVLIAHCKKLQDSIDLYPKDSSEREKIQQELEFLSPYRPTMLEQDQIVQMIEDILKQDPSAKMGVVMKELSPKIKGRFDGKKASDLVKSQLNGAGSP